MTQDTADSRLVQVQVQGRFVPIPIYKVQRDSPLRTSIFIPSTSTSTSTCITITSLPFCLCNTQRIEKLAAIAEYSSVEEERRGKEMAQIECSKSAG